MNKHAISLILLLFATSVIFSECKECREVKKGTISKEYLDKNYKQLPSGIKIWDAPEAIAELNKADPTIIWIDTRPKSFISQGTIKGSVNLVYDQKGVELASEDKDKELTQASLIALLKQKSADISTLKVAFFCQGPECHRSYNVALRSVNDFGLQPSQVIWFRDGYPGMLTYINADPKLKRKISSYLEGKVLTE